MQENAMPVHSPIQGRSSTKPGLQGPAWDGEGKTPCLSIRSSGHLSSLGISSLTWNWNMIKYTSKTSAEIAPVASMHVRQVHFLLPA